MRRGKGKGEGELAYEFDDWVGESLNQLVSFFDNGGGALRGRGGAQGF